MNSARFESPCKQNSVSDERNPYESSALIQVFWRDTISLYDEQLI